MNKLIVFPLFFFLLFSITSYAYTDYAYNPTFTSDINGLIVYAPNYANINYTYNATCSGLSGCLFLYTNASDHYQVILKNADAASPVTVRYENVTGYSDYYNDLPAYTEGIVTLNMQFNATPSNIPYVQILNANPATAPGMWSALAYVELDATDGQWNNKTITIPAGTFNRHVAVVLNFYPDNPVALTMLDKFKFYTFDVTTARNSVLTDYATESAYYCGEATQTQDEWDKKSTAANNYVAMMVSNLTYDGIDCCVYQTNYTIMARRCNKHPTANNLVWNSSDVIFTKDGYDQLLVIKQISVSQMTYSGYLATSVSPCTLTNYIVWNGAGTFNWNCESLNASDTTYVFDKVIAFVNKSGTLFNLTRATDKSPYYSFFSQRAFVPSCTCTDAMETCLSYPNVVSNTSCGTCGCDLNNQYCLINSSESGLSGTWCDANDTAGLNFFTYINDAASCTQFTTTGSCPAGTQCVFHAPTRAIECYNNATGQHQECVNSDGIVVTCASLGITSALCWNGASYVSCPDTTTDYGSTIALWFGSLFGFGNNLVISRNITSIILTLVISFIIVALMAYAGVGGKALTSIFMVSSMMLLVLFTLILWFPSWLFVIMIVLTALGVSGLLGKIIGGG